jgi:hypothetical protein
MRMLYQAYGRYQPTSHPISPLRLFLSQKDFLVWGASETKPTSLCCHDLEPEENMVPKFGVGDVSSQPLGEGSLKQVSGKYRPPDDVTSSAL